jgi:hypothetical protein
MMLFNRHQTFSIYFDEPLLISQFLSSFSFDSSFNPLASLVSNEPQSNILIPLLTNLACLPRLFSLILHVPDDSTDVYRIILRLPLLKYHNLFTDQSDLLASLPVIILINDLVLSNISLLYMIVLLTIFWQ